MNRIAAPVQYLMNSARWRRALRHPAKALRNVARRLSGTVAPPPPAAGPTPPGMVEFDKYRKSGAYHWDYLAERAEYRLHVEAVCCYATPGGSALDLGCGDAAYVYHVAARCAEVVGVDGDPDGVRCARAELARHGVANARLIEATFAELPRHLKAGRTFDLIYSMDCVEHLLDPAELVHTALRYLAPDGVVMIGTPLFLDERSVSPYHVQEFTREGLDAILTPHLRPVARYCLPAPVPHRTDLVDRFYIFVGQRPTARRWLPPFAPPADTSSDGVALRHTLPPPTAPTGLRTARPEVYYSPVAWAEVPSTAIAADAAGPADFGGWPDALARWLGSPCTASVLTVGSAPPAAALNLEPVRCTAASAVLPLPYSDASFDCVFCPDALGRAADPTALLTELLRVARRHVLLGLVTGNGAAQAAGLVYDPKRDRLFEPVPGAAGRAYRYANTFAPDDLKELLARAGVSDYQCEELRAAEAKEVGRTRVCVRVVR